MNIEEIMQPVVQAASVAFAAMLSWLLGQSISLVRTWLARRAVNSAIATAAGIVALQVASGALSIKDVSNASHPAVLNAAEAALSRVPDSAKSQGTTTESAAAILTGIIGRAFLGDPYSALQPATVPPFPALSAKAN